MNQDQGNAGGFFSKVLLKVKAAPEPAAPPQAPPQAFTPVVAADSTDPAPDLQQLQERKRRNDAIRRQEFAALRQLRAATTSDIPVPEHAAAFLSSVIEAQDLASTTLEKIDAIEAQMSHQWWQRPGEAGVEPTFDPSAGMPTAPSPANELPKGRASVSKLTETQRRSIPTLGVESIVAPEDAAAEVAYARSSLDLEEAAILFANGDFDSAKARLLELLVYALDAQPLDNEAVGAIWNAALDLYRATGDAEGFEPLAVDYGAHFRREKPLWVSMPEHLKMAPLDGPVTPVVARPPMHWRAPGSLTAEALASLDRQLHATTEPCRLDWSGLQGIDDEALLALTKLIDAWASWKQPIVWIQGAQLLALLERQTPLGHRASDTQWWRLRLAALRLCNQPQAFDQVSLDYCMTYEVSPPSWAAPASPCVMLQDAGEGSGWAQSLERHPLNVMPASDTPLRAAQPLQPRDWGGLAGVIEGDAMPWLQPLQARARLGEPLDIACDWLIRLDFVAAGALLAWAADMQLQGHTLRFTQLHRLVAVFLELIGLPEHAKLAVRRA